MEALQVKLLLLVEEKCSLGLRRGDDIVILGEAPFVFS